jgi:nucleoside-diphosphate-sugar epimerase
MCHTQTKRVFVTGASGFIGRHCLPFLISNGYEVHAADLLAPKENTHGLHWHQVDLLDMKQSDELIASIRPSHLLHFAWYAKPGEYWTSTENISWVKASLALLQSFAHHGGQRVVMAGTCAEYDWDYGYCSPTVTPLRPATLYGVCKHSLQMMLNAFSSRTGLSSAWGRIFFLYGPYEHPDKLVSSIICSLLKNEPARCTHGNQIRDYLFVEDVASAFVSLLMSPVNGPVNIASGRPITLRELALAAADCLNARERVHFGALPSPPNEPPMIIGDNRHLTDEVGWKPKYDLAAGISRTVSYWQERSRA